MHDFTTKDMSDLLYDILSEIKDDETNKTRVVLDTPESKSKFPCRVIDTPIERINKTENAIPILKTFQATIEHWTSKPKECMEMANKTDIQLRKYNLIRTNTNSIIFDEITKKYRLITTYEVRYNSIMNSFEFIR